MGHYQESMWQDLRYGVRVLLKKPGFTLIVVITLALGMGANIAIFGMVDVLLFKHLPVKDPQQLVFVQRAQPDDRPGGDDVPVRIFEQFRDLNNSFSGMSAYSHTPVSVTVDGHSEIIRGDFVSGNYFEVLGVSTILGRTFTREDDFPGGQPVAVISYSYWERQFARDPSAVGKTIYLGRVLATVIGVTPSGFFGVNVAESSADVTLPMFMQAQLALKDIDTATTVTPDYYHRVIARLKHGVGHEQALAELDAIYQQVRVLEPTASMSAPKPVEAQPARVELKPALTGESTLDDEAAKAIWILACVVGIVLLIASVNVAGLLLARASERQKEIAIRSAIGATRSRLICQLLTESVLLGMLAGVLGLVLARWSAGGIITLLSYGLGVAKIDVALDARLLAFSGALSLLTSVLFGLAPALSTTRIDLNTILKGNEGAARFRPGRSILVKSLVVAQVALSLVLLIVAGLLVRSLRQLYHVDTGFERDKVLTMWVYPGLIGYDQSREIKLYREVLERINAIPGVQSASLSLFPLYRGGVGLGPRFFETEGIPILLGREFSSSDTESSPRVAVISESLARKYFPNENPVGQRFSWKVGGYGDEDAGGYDIQPGTGEVEIVGVAKDIAWALRDWKLTAIFYFPYSQVPPKMLGHAEFLVRTSAGPANIVPVIRQAVQSVDKDLALVNVKTQAEEFNDIGLGRERTMAALLGFFGALALVLAALGLYGTLAYAVARRTKEFGIRMALGARRKEILGMVLRDTLSLVASGVVVGIAGAMVANRFISSMLFEVKATDPLTISISVLVMFAAAFLAGYIPARRATKVDPMVALRCE
jgi:ABC-type antimicrobial peptide transport system permease subunit